MPPLYPHSGSDLALAPVLLQLERELERLRHTRSIPVELALELDDLEGSHTTPHDRAHRVVRAVTRNVNLHGLEVAPSADLTGVTVSHGEYRVTLTLGSRLMDYVRDGASSPVAHV